jgi:predicted phage terminase large subunit-like protein
VTEAALLFGNLRATRMEIAKRRAELHLIDFVELLWPTIEPEQPFVRGWVQEAICEHLEAVTDGRITKLLCNVPPGSTKTALVNVFWPAWEWGPRNRPDLRYMSWSYSAKLTEDANDACRRLIESEVYQRFWGDRFELDDTSNAKSFYKNSKGGWRRSSSIGGAATGFRADRLIFDDPHSVKDADSVAALREATRWFARTLPTRVRNTSGGISNVKVPFWVRDVHGLGLDDDPDDGGRKATASATVGIMQRVHLHDISGIILKNPGLGYEVLLIEMRFKGAQHPARRAPAWRSSSIGYVDPRTEIGQLCDPIRFPEEAVAELEAQLMLEGGSDAVAAQLDQWPLETSGTWFKVEWLPDVAPGEIKLPLGKRGWDWAASETATSNATAHAHLTRDPVTKKFYIVDSAELKGGPGKVEAFVKKQHETDPKGLDWSIPKDPGAAGALFAGYIVREVAPGRHVHVSAETGSKVTRAKPVSAQAEHMNLAIVRHPGWERLRQCLVDFPYGDVDLVDAVSRAFAALVAQPATPKTVVGGYAITPGGN